MVFDCDLVTELVEEWCISKDTNVLEEIIHESTSLAEVIASRFPSEYRDDMIQECLIRIQYAIGHYDPKISNLHAYLTSVFINRCNSFIAGEVKQYRLAEELAEVNRRIAYDITIDGEELLEELIIRNRERFPSIPVDVIDDTTHFILDCIINGVHGKSRGAIASMMRIYGFKRNIASVIYHSTLVYIRTLYEDFSAPEDEPDDEFSLLPELRDVLGVEAYDRISIMFSGLYFKVP